MNMGSTIGSRIREARRRARRSQAELGRAVGVSQASVNRWEAGTSEPNNARIGALANTLGVAPEWLAFGRRSPGAAGAVPVTGAAGGPAGGDESAMARIVAFQGIPGAYSQLACRAVLPDAEAVSCETFEDAFESVADGRADLAMIPIENSLGGRVADIHHLLPESSLSIIGEHFQPVHHCLLAPPGGRLEDIRVVRSHTQALAQCRDHIRELGLRTEHRADTAGAAREVAGEGDPTVAAIASELAAETYGLEIMRARIEDRIGNVTRFVIMSRQRREPDPRDGETLTSLVFQVRSVPAALYKGLGGFATNGVNIIRLESYISITAPTVARFYIEIEGHPAQKAMDRALEELQFYTTWVKILGVYPAHPFRREEG